MRQALFYIESIVISELEVSVAREYVYTACSLLLTRFQFVASVTH